MEVWTGPTPQLWGNVVEWVSECAICGQILASHWPLWALETRLDVFMPQLLRM